MNIEVGLGELEKTVPKIFTNPQNIFQSVFHLTEDVAGKIDGIPLDTDTISELYAHTPIVTLYDHTYGCPTTCDYCAYFTKSPPDNKKMLESQLLLKEKERRSVSEILKGKKVSSIYFGGGTPTILTEDLMTRLIKRYRAEFTISTESEITVEAHPNTINDAKLDCLNSLGVNRLSIGIESLDDFVLKNAHRGYTKEKALNVIKKAIKYFPIVNVDIIYGLEYQTLDSYKQTLTVLANLGVHQITAYALWLKEGSGVSKDFNIGRIQNYPSNKEKAGMYLYTKEYLAKKGFSETLLGWFVKKDKHIKIYSERWVDKIPCIGIGPGAYSYGETWHYTNVSDWKSYRSLVENKKLPIKDGYVFGLLEKNIVDLMWKIKSGTQFQPNELQQKMIEKFIDQKLLAEDNNYVTITDKGKIIKEWMIGKLIRNAQNSV